MYKVHIIDDPVSLIAKVYVLMEGNQDYRAVLNGTEWKKITPNVDASDIKPTLELSDRRMLPALADALAQHGIKSSNDHKLEGTLEATRLHLDDMRKLVFEPNVTYGVPQGKDEV